jgi:hypothetical protein
LGLVELALVATLALVDWLWITSVAMRVVGLCLLAGAAIGIVFLALGGIRRLGRSEAAVAVEESFPQLGQRVRTTLEYAEPLPTTAPASAGLVDALVDDTDRQTRRIDLKTLIPWRRLRWEAATLAVLAAVGLVTLAVSPELRVAIERLLLLPAHYTTLKVEPGDRQVKVGGDVLIQAELTGRPVRHVELRYRIVGNSSDSEKAQAWEVDSLAGRETVDVANDLAQGSTAITGKIEKKLSGLEEDLEYQVVAGQRASDIYRLTIVRPLVLKEVAATITPPAYTRRPTTVEAKGNVKVIEGSHLELAFKLDRPPQSALLALRPTSPHAEAVPQPAVRIDGATLSADLATIDQELEYELTAEAADGMKLEPKRFHVRVQPDQKPSVRFIEPPEQLEVTITTEVAMHLEASDDFGVGKMGIVYQIADGPERELYLEDLPQQPLSVETLATLFLERHDVYVTDAVTYYAFAEDNRPVEPGRGGAPNRAMTELRFIDIRPYKRTYHPASSDGGGGSGESSTSLEELILRQRMNLNRSFAQLDVPVVDGETAARLARTEQELGKVTREFAAGMERLGMPVPSLVEAAASMQQAVDELSGRRMKPAVEHEQAALAGLIKARQPFRRYLSTNNSQSASACRKFDTDQRQKLRPPKDEDDKAKQAQLANDLAQLAEQEKKFSEEVSPKGSSMETDQQDEHAPPKPQQTAQSKAQSSSQSPSQSSSNSQSPSQGQSPAEAQQAAAQQAEELNARVRDDQDLTQLAKDRMDAAAQAVRRSAQAMNQGDSEQAAHEAADAAESLKRLAEQVAALKANETAAKLAKMSEMANRLAAKQRELAQQIGQEGAAQDKDEKTNGGAAAKGQRPSSSEKQAEAEEQLAGDARTLADVVNRVRTDAADESRELSQALTKAALANPPAEAAEQMEQAAEGLRRGDRDGAVEPAQAAAESLAGLAQALAVAHRELVHAELDKFLAAEKRAAETQAAVTSATDEGQKAEAEKQMGELNETMQTLSSSGGKVSQAAEELAAAIHLAAGHWDRDDRDPKGAYVPPQAYLNGLRRTIEALQATIQEIVLNEAQLDRDGAVPPEYREFVDEYYRVLSEDLR